MRTQRLWFVLGVIAPSMASAAEAANSGAPPLEAQPATTEPAATEIAPTEPVATEPPPVVKPQSLSEPAPETAPTATEFDTAEAATPPPDQVASTVPGPQQQFSLYMGSPIWLTNTPFDPGFEVEMRSGIKIKSFVPEVGVGARWNWFNVDKLEQQFPGVNNPNRYAGENLTGLWLSLGIRFEPELPSAVIQPYVSLAFDANLWGFSYETTEVCGFWSCGTVRQYDFAPGFSGRVGVRIHPTPSIGIDLGAKPAMTFQGWAFENTHAWIEPYAGATFLLGSTRR
jgi:hypothetical protein